MSFKNSKGELVNIKYLHENDISKLSTETLEIASKFLTANHGLKPHIINPLATFVSMEIQNRNNRKSYNRSIAASVFAISISVLTLIVNVYFNFKSNTATQDSLNFTKESVELSLKDASNDEFWRKEQISILKKIQRNTSK